MKQIDLGDKLTLQSLWQKKSTNLGFETMKGLILCLLDTGWPLHQWTQRHLITGYNREATPGYNIKSKNSFPSRGQQKWLLQRGGCK